MNDETVPVEQAFEEIVADAPAPRIRNSYRYRVNAKGMRLMPDFVFADNPDEAVVKARQRYEIPDEVEVSVVRIDDVSHLELRIN